MNAKWIYGVLAITVFVTVALSFAGWYAMRQLPSLVANLADQAGITIQYEAPKVNLSGITAKNVHVSGTGFDIAFERVSVGIYWRSLWRLQGIGVKLRHGSLTLIPTTSSDATVTLSAPPEPLALPDIPALLETYRSYFTYFGGIEVIDLAVHVDALTISGISGTVEQGGNGRIRVAQIDHPQTGMIRDLQLDFSADGHAYQLLWNLRLAPQTIQGVELSDTLRLKGAIDLRQQIVLLREGRVALPMVILHPTATIGLETFEARLTGEAHTASRWHDMKLPFEATAAGSYRDLRYQATINGTEWHALMAHLPSMKITVEGNLDAVRATLQTDTSEAIRVAAQYRFGDPTIALEATLNNARLQDYIYPTIKYIDLREITGQAKGALHLKTLTTTLDAEVALMYNSFATPLRATAKTSMIIDRNHIAFQNGSAHSPHMNATASGALYFHDLNNFFDLHAEGTVHRIAPLVKPFWIDFIDGSGTFALHITGEAENPRVNVSASGTDLRVFDGIIDRGSGQVEVYGNEVKILAVTAEIAEGIVSMPRGYVRVADADSVEIHFPFSGTALPSERLQGFGNLTLPPFDFPVIDSIEGRISGNGRAPNVAVAFRSAPTQGSQWNIPELHGNLTFSPELVLRGTLVEQWQPHNELKGSIDFTRERLDLTFSGSQIEPQTYYPKLLPAFSMSIQQVNAVAKGTFTKPRVSFELAQGVLRENAERLTIVFDAKGDATEERATVTFPELDVIWPVRASAPGATVTLDLKRGEQRVHGRVTSQYGDLNVNALMKGVSPISLQLAGTSDLEIFDGLTGGLIQGKGGVALELAGEEVIEGYVRFAPEAYIIPKGEPQLKLADVSTSLEFDRQEDRLSFRTLRASLGRNGLILGNGDVWRDEEGELSWKTDLSLTGFSYQTGENLIMADAHGSARSRSGELPYLSGEVDIRRGQLSSRTTRGGSSVAPGTGGAPSQIGAMINDLPFEGIISLRSSAPVTVLLNEGKVVIQPTLEGVKRDGYFALRGTIDVLSGDLLYNSNTFLLKRGQMTFDQSFQPHLALNATTSRQGYTIFVSIAGTPTNPIVNFRSIPSLPREKIVQMLVLGDVGDDLAPTSAASYLLAGRLVESLNTMTGMFSGASLFSVSTSGLMTDHADISIGKELSSRLEIKVTQDIGAEREQQIEVIYKIFDFLHIKGRERLGGSYGVEIEYRIGH
ncbi:translocation/assembly module TamB domain-containing protein [Chrysiogenes arsenatis]|uniref:translocation/assembly module TamB domain-containing protein n=1 Tax=Chrysiogenes arsenatis TaxID=309797 RepID=UPI0003F7EEC1|nr:translocation/assembly module TamB domain-containing protein [Chrysiogenes arsenatis]